MARTWLNKGGKPVQALACLDLRRKLLQKQKKHKPEQAAQVLHLMAMAEHEAGFPMDETLARLKVCRKICKASKDWNNLLEIYLTTGQVYAESQEHYHVAEECYDHGLEVVRHQNKNGRLNSYLARFFLAKGDLLQRQHIFEMQAAELYREALSICQSSLTDIDPEIANEALVALADLHCSQGQDTEGLAYLQQGKPLVLVWRKQKLPM